MESFGDYIQRMSYKRKRLFDGIKSTTFYRRVKNPDSITIAELRFLMRISELDEERVMKYIREGK